MLRKVRLYGSLAKFVGKRVLEADISSAAEAVKFLMANFPGVEQHISKIDYQIEVAGAHVAKEELHYPLGPDDIKIIPVVAGAGGKGTWKIIAGVVLIGIAILVPGSTVMYGQFTAAAGTGFWTGAAAFGGNIGMALVLSGVADMLTPTPKVPDSQDDPTNSWSFSGVQNSSRAGIPIPVCYGEVMTGSIVISAGIDVDQIQAP